MQLKHYITVKYFLVEYIFWLEVRKSKIFDFHYLYNISSLKKFDSFDLLKIKVIKISDRV